MPLARLLGERTYTSCVALLVCLDTHLFKGYNPANNQTKSIAMKYLHMHFSG
jgi:hypothetical protein